MGFGVLGFWGFGSEGQLALRFGEATGTLDEAVAQRVQGVKPPRRRTLGLGAGVPRRGEHLQLSTEVVGYHGTEGDDLVARLTPGGDQVEATVLLGLAEETFLGAAAVVELQDVAC